LDGQDFFSPTRVSIFKLLVFKVFYQVGKSNSLTYLTKKLGPQKLLGLMLAPKSYFDYLFRGGGLNWNDKKQGIVR